MYSAGSLLSLTLGAVLQGRGRLVALVGILALTGACGPALAADSLAGRWRFDEAAGQRVVDDGPFGLDGTLGTTPVADAGDPIRTSGAAGRALRFGGGQHVHVPAGRRQLDLPTLTVEAVGRAGSPPDPFRYLVSHGGRDCFAGAYGLYTAADGGLAFYIFDGERYFVSPSAPPTAAWDGQWHRFSGSFDGRAVRAYLDGRQIGDGLATPVGTAIEYLSMPGDTYFGDYVGPCRLAFSGDIDGVQIWSGAGEGASPTPGPGPAPDPVGSGSALTPVAPEVPIAAGAKGRVIIAPRPPRAACTVTVARRKILVRRRQTVRVRVQKGGTPIRHARLSVRRTGSLRLLASPRTDARGRAAVVLRERRRGRLRIGVVGRAGCRPAFVTVASRKR